MFFKRTRGNLASTTQAGIERLRKYKKGVKIKIAAVINDDNKKLVKQFNGAEVRSFNKNMRFCAVDGKEMTLMLMDDKDVHESYDSGIWINTPYFVKNFQNMFDNEWKSMKKF